MGSDALLALHDIINSVKWVRLT